MSGTVDGKLGARSAWVQDKESPATASAIPLPPSPGVALRLDYRFAGQTGERVLLNGADLLVPHTHLTASFQVHGDGNGHTLVFFVVDDGGEHHSYKAMPVDWVGWRQFEFPLLTGFRAHWGGNGTRRVDFPLRQAGFVLWHQGQVCQPEGRLFLADLHFRTPDLSGAGHLEDGAWLCKQMMEEDLACVPIDVRQVLERVMTHRGECLGRLQAPGQGQQDRDAIRQEIEALCRWCHHIRARPEAYRVAAWRGPGPSGATVVVAPTSALEKVHPAELPSLATSSLRLKTARGEWASAQVVAAALDEPIANVSLRMGALRHESGAVLPQTVVDWHPVDCVQVRRGICGRSEQQLWPDAFLPATPVPIPSFASRSFWITARVPADALPGTYTGTVELLVDGIPRADVEVALRVSDLTLPVKCHLKTAFGVDTWSVSRFSGRDSLSDEEYLRWVRFLLDRRIHGDRLVGSYHWRQESEACMVPSPAAIVAAQLTRFDFFWAARVTNTLLFREDDERRRVERRFLDALAQTVERLRAQDILHQAYLYTYDELTAADYERVRPFLAACRQVAPSLKVVLSFFRDDPVDSLGEYVDVWCPSYYWVAQNTETVQALQRSGAEVWWYFTEDVPPRPNVAVDAPLLNHRIIFWLTFHLGFAGLLHWETCYWGTNMHHEPRWPERRWVASLVDRETDRYIYHGNGSLLYPGPNSTPLSSIRLETLRQGAEDFEYLWLLRERIATGRIPARLRARAEELLDLSDLIQDVTHYEDDVQRYEARRQAIGEILEQAEGAGL